MSSKRPDLDLAPFFQSSELLTRPCFFLCEVRIVITSGTGWVEGHIDETGILLHGKAPVKRERRPQLAQGTKVPH